MSALTAGVNKKRKKSDTKPQAQINKCNNEKRRREQENIYIEELAELISANFADMSSLSVKPDKCAILQETVNQIRSIKQRETSQSSDPVQQGEVSSSRPTILSNAVYGPLLLEALEGFLFVVNSEGKVEHVTENVSEYIRYTQEEVLGKSIYNFIHHGDHARFSASLLPMAIGWARETNNRSRSFSCRLVVKPPDDLDESIEDKQQRTTHYELMHISSTQLKDQVAVTDEESGDSGPCLLCVASRLTHRDKVAGSAGIEQFTTKLDTTGKIIAVDTSGVSSNYSKFLNKDHLTGRVLHELCMPHDVNKLSVHLRETLNTGQGTSAIYRIKLGPEKFVAVQTKSKLFKAHPIAQAGESDFVMATHSIIGENDSSGPSDPGGGSNSSGVGGPLMTSVVNGTSSLSRNGAAPISSSNESSTSNTLINTPTNTTPFPNLYMDNEFGFDLIPTSSTWPELDSNWGTEVRPDSRQSVTPVNVTPTSTSSSRPPSQPVFSPATTIAQSPLHFVTQASPSIQNPTTPVSNYSNSFSFSPINEAPPYPTMDDQKDSKANVMEEASSMMSDSNRLRILLTKPSSIIESSANSSTGEIKSNNDHKILKGLLKQQDDEDSDRGNNRINRPGPSQLGDIPKSSSGPNKLLEKLLNDRPANEEIDSPPDEKKNEFLKSILTTSPMGDGKQGNSQMNNDSQSIFSKIPSPPNTRKRHLNDSSEEQLAKRHSDGVTSSGGPSKLCEKNRMLAMLLAKEPSNIQNIPPIPPSELTATPQERLPRITPDPNINKAVQRVNMNQNHNMSQGTVCNSRVSQNNQQRPTGRPANNYMPQLSLDGNQENRQYQVDSTFPSPASSSSDWNSKPVDDSQIISIILDDLLETELSGGGLDRTIDTNEKAAISMIEKNLIQSTVTNVGLATPPAYNSVTSQNNQAYGPPPNYSRANINMQRQGANLRAGAPQFSTGPNAAAISPQQLLAHQNRNKLLLQQQQEQHKRRLLQQQQQQIIVQPAAGQSNPLTVNDLNTGMIENILNNTVAPNVSLQRSSSVTEQPVVSPNFVNPLSQTQNQRINNQPPYSPHQQITSPIGQQGGFNQSNLNNYPQTNTRLSPLSFNQELSPRQSFVQTSTQNAVSWPPQRLTIQQQQNPLLNAQLTPNNYIGSNRTYSVQRAQASQRGIGSPGAAATRHSPYPQDAFPPPASPNSSFNATQQQQQYLRLQRANSAPTANTQMTGGLGSPRPYGRDHPPHPSPYPMPHPNSNPIPHPNNAPHPMMYPQQDSSYLYDQSGLQMSSYGTDRARSSLPTHLQGGVSAAGTTSEYVRQELRAVVGARTGQAQTGAIRPQMLNQNAAVAAELETLGLNFEMAPAGASESPKLWGAMASDMGALSPQAASSRTTTEAGDGKSSSSLLQKLLSE